MNSVGGSSSAPRSVRATVPLLFLLTVGLPAAVRAQDQAAPRTVQSLFEDGTDAIREGRFADARDLLREAHDRARRVGTAFNLAVALRGTGEVVACTELFDALLALEFGELPDATRAQVVPLRAECAALRARLTVRVEGPQRAELSIDGRPVGEVVADADPARWLDPGTYVLTLRAPGREERTRSVTMARGEARTEAFELPFDSALARLTVNARPTDSEVEIEGVGRGASPFQRALEPGSYTVRLLLDGEAATEALVALEAGEDHTLLLDATQSLLDDPLFWTIGAILLAGVAAAAIATPLLLIPPTVAPPVGNAFFPEPIIVP